MALPIGAIVAIAIGGAAVIFVVLAICLRQRRQTTEHCKDSCGLDVAHRLEWFDEAVQRAFQRRTPTSEARDMLISRMVEETLEAAIASQQQRQEDATGQDQGGSDALRNMFGDGSGTSFVNHSSGDYGGTSPFDSGCFPLGGPRGAGTPVPLVPDIAYMLQKDGRVMMAAEKLANAFFDDCKAVIAEYQGVLFRGEPVKEPSHVSSPPRSPEKRSEQETAGEHHSHLHHFHFAPRSASGCVPKAGCVLPTGETQKYVSRRLQLLDAMGKAVASTQHGTVFVDCGWVPSAAKGAAGTAALNKSPRRSRSAVASSVPLSADSPYVGEELRYVVSTGYVEVREFFISLRDAVFHTNKLRTRGYYSFYTVADDYIEMLCEWANTVLLEVADTIMHRWQSNIHETMVAAVTLARSAAQQRILVEGPMHVARMSAEASEQLECFTEAAEESQDASTTTLAGQVSGSKASIVAGLLASVREHYQAIFVKSPRMDEAPEAMATCCGNCIPDVPDIRRLVAAGEENLYQQLVGHVREDVARMLLSNKQHRLVHGEVLIAQHRMLDMLYGPKDGIPVERWEALNGTASTHAAAVGDGMPGGGLGKTGTPSKRPPPPGGPSTTEAPRIKKVRNRIKALFLMAEAGCTDMMLGLETELLDDAAKFAASHEALRPYLDKIIAEIETPLRTMAHKVTLLKLCHRCARDICSIGRQMHGIMQQSSKASLVELLEEQHSVLEQLWGSGGYIGWVPLSDVVASYNFYAKTLHLPHLEL